jgi:tetratricopeptide (TPR) repeat protein
LPQHLYAETLLTPGLGGSFQWRYQNHGRGLLSVVDPESPVYRALGQAIDRFENTVFALTLNKPNLIEWANAQETLQDAADRRELRLGGAHVFQQSIELFQGMQMMTTREEDPVRLSAIHHNIGDVMGFIGQRSGSVHWLEQASLSYDQALELRTEDNGPVDWALTTYNLGVVLHTLGQLEEDNSLLKRAHQTYTQAATQLPRDSHPQDWSAAL